MVQQIAPGVPFSEWNYTCLKNEYVGARTITKWTWFCKWMLTLCTKPNKAISEVATLCLWPLPMVVYISMISIQRFYLDGTRRLGELQVSQNVFFIQLGFCGVRFQGIWGVPLCPKVMCGMIWTHPGPDQLCRKSIRCSSMLEFTCA